MATDRRYEYRVRWRDEFGRLARSHGEVEEQTFRSWPAARKCASLETQPGERSEILRREVGPWENF